MACSTFSNAKFNLIIIIDESNTLAGCFTVLI